MMQALSILMAGLTAITLFISGLENFSAEIEQIAGDRFCRFLARAGGSHLDAGLRTEH